MSSSIVRSAPRAVENDPTMRKFVPQSNDAGGAASGVYLDEWRVDCSSSLECRVIAPSDQNSAQGVGIIGAVSHQPLWGLAGASRVMGASDDDSVQGALQQRHLLGRGRVQIYSQRSARAIDQNHPLRALAALDLPDVSAPFWPGQNCHQQSTRPNGSSGAYSGPPERRATSLGRRHSFPTLGAAANRYSGFCVREGGKVSEHLKCD